MTDQPDFVPRFLLGLPEPEPEVATIEVRDPLHVRWRCLHRWIGIGVKTPWCSGPDAPSVEEDGERVTTLTVRKGEAWVRHDVETLDQPAVCAVYRDGAVELVDEATGYREVRRSPGLGAIYRRELKEHVDYVRSRKARLGF